jgi:hypothetical protein
MSISEAARLGSGFRAPTLHKLATDSQREHVNVTLLTHPEHETAIRVPQSLGNREIAATLVISQGSLGRVTLSTSSPISVSRRRLRSQPGSPSSTWPGGTHGPGINFANMEIRVRGSVVRAQSSPHSQTGGAKPCDA